MSQGYVKAGVIGGLIAAAISIVGFIPILSCLILPVSCIAWLAVPLGTGYYAAKLEGVKDTSEAAKLGALAGLIMGSINSVIRFGLTLLSVGLGFATSAGSSPSNMDFFGNAGESLFAGGAVVIGGICGIIVGILFSACFAALGGLIKASMKDSNASTPQTKVDSEEAVVVVDDTKKKSTKKNK